MKNAFKKILFAIAALGFVVCSAFRVKQALDSPNDPMAKNIDPSVSPGEDFFKYANGTWLKKNPIPPAYSSWGIGNTVTEEIRNRLRKINEDALKANAPAGSSTQKIGDFYYTGLDSVGIEKAGISPLQQQLNLIDQSNNTQDILNAVAML